MNNKMDQILQEMERIKLEVLEREMRKRNLIIIGVKEDESEGEEQMVEKVELELY